MIDAIVARSLLVPALVALFGRAGMWPGGRSLPATTQGWLMGPLSLVAGRSSRPGREKYGYIAGMRKPCAASRASWM